MESRNNLCNVRGIIASLSERVETMKRRNDEMPERNDITTNDDEPGWSVIGRTRKTTGQTCQVLILPKGPLVGLCHNLSTPLKFLNDIAWGSEICTLCS